MARTSRQHRWDRKAWLVLALSGYLALPGCMDVSFSFGSSDLTDLVNYIDQVNARKSRKIEPLPEIKVPEVHLYGSSAKADPFETFIVEEPKQVVIDPKKGGITPPANHIREELEYFPLDSLRMVGTLDMGEESWGLISAPDKAVHRVQPGNYIGRNYGKIVMVGEDHLEIVEIVSDGIGGWEERPANVDLSETSE
ncbi:MAG: pilus assembly protein PilP [Gammaproteobacteria bacterium]|nr:pilus assembly protein PilP [Gammaproteobacteria bacterium]